MNVQAVLVGIIPSLGVLAIFFFVVRGIIRADRNERAAIAKEEARIETADSSHATSPDQ